MSHTEAPAGLAFRAATQADVDDIVALVESAYRGPSSRQGWTTEADLLDGQRTDGEEVGSLVGGADGVVILAGPPGRAPVGCCHLRLTPGQPAYFGMFAVDPLLQAQGVGAALLAEAEARAVAAGAGTLRMTVLAQRGDLIGWYERRGYRRTGETLPFPSHDPRFGLPRRNDLVFEVLERALPGGGEK